VNARFKVAFPCGVATVTFRADCVAPLVIVQLALTDVAVELMPPQVMPPPDIVTPVAPDRLVPVSVTGTVVPWVPVVGLIAVSVAPCTVKVTALVVPSGVVTVTFLFVSPAVVVIVNVAVTVVSLTTATLLTLTPVPETVTPLAPVSPAPVRVTLTAEPRNPDEGAIDDSVAPVTVNVTLLLVPPSAVTVTL